MKNPKHKGTLFENDVCKYLNKMTGSVFVRSHLRDSNNKDEIGDLYCDNYNDIVIECKSYREPLTFSELFNDASRFESWIKKLKSLNKKFIIFIKTNNRGVLYFCNDVNVLVRLRLLDYGYKKLDDLYFNKADDFL